MNFFKVNRNKIKHIIILLMAMITILLIFTKNGSIVYGSQVDWISQHFSLPDYFRKLFYDTGDLFPSFAFNIGGGQNIYYFSYYGLLSPIILISYLLPFVDMMDYIIVSSVVTVAISVVLIYLWLCTHYDENISFVSSFVFLCATPLLFHSHRHIMFITYMPFLILALFAVDYFFKKKKTISLSILIFLIIMTSYFFSVGSIIFISLYAVCVYLELNKGNITLKGFLSTALNYSLYVIAGVAMSGILILPTAYVLLNGRGGNSEAIPWLEYLLPSFNLSETLYSPYSLGLTFFALAAIANGVLSKSIKIKILSISISLCLTFKVFLFILNGTLYVDGKALIPFLPLAIMIVAELLKDLTENKFKYSTLIIAGVYGLASMYINESAHKEYLLLILFDVIFSALIIKFNKNKPFKVARYIPLLALVFVFCTYTNQRDKFVTKEAEAETDYDTICQLVDKIDYSSTGVVRTANLVSALENINTIYNEHYYQTTVYSSASNQNYHDFYFNSIFNENSYRNSSIMSQPKSALFNIYMGNRYLITKEATPIGYTEKGEIDGIKILENKRVFPIGYATSKIMSKQEYDSLQYPYNMEAYLNYAIIDDNSLPVTAFESTIDKIDFDDKCIDIPQIVKAEKEYLVECKKETKLEIPLDTPLHNKLLLIRFHVDNTENRVHDDVSITINDIKNKLTVPDWKYYNENEWFEYVINSDEDIDKINIILSKGNYKIKDISVYTMDYSHIQAIRNSIYDLNIDSSLTSGDTIVGDIQSRRDGCLLFSIPYDEGFTLYVDGKEQQIIRTDNDFIGTYLSGGQHEIKLVYKAPYRTYGIVLSSFGILMLFILFMTNRKPKNK